MMQDDLEAQLTATIQFALGQYRYRPPRTRDTGVTDTYNASVAAAIVRQIKLSGWDLTASRTLDKRPPRLTHSTSMFMDNEAHLPGPGDKRREARPPEKDE